MNFSRCSRSERCSLSQRHRRLRTIGLDVGYFDLEGSNRGHRLAIHGYDSAVSYKSFVEVVCEAAEMRILPRSHGSITNGFCFASYDPSLELLGELTVRILGSVAGIALPFHRGSLARLPRLHRLPHSHRVRCPCERPMMHDHCDAAGATAMGPEDSEERRVAVVGILGIVEESGLGPLATADVGLGRQLPTSQRSGV